ncbi:MAG TPA: hypothetical protein DIC52_04925 [Candidatus Latescibacteria bacterium]|nr:hypothetical protein [Candidatus Latescibacterota bacterium]
MDQSQLVPTPDDVPMDIASLLACGVITGFVAVCANGQSTDPAVQDRRPAHRLHLAQRLLRGAKGVPSIHR